MAICRLGPTTPSIHQSIHPPIHPSTNPPIHHSTNPSILFRRGRTCRTGVQLAHSVEHVDRARSTRTDRRPQRHPKEDVGVQLQQRPANRHHLQHCRQLAHHVRFDPHLSA